MNNHLKFNRMFHYFLAKFLFLGFCLIFGWIAIYAPMPVQASLVGYWRFDESSGSVIADASGNVQNGTLENGVTWTTGKLQNAIQFDGIDDRVSVITSESMNNMGMITISGWIYPQASSGVILRKSASGTARFNIHIDKDGYLSFRAGYNEVIGVWKMNTPLMMNQWQHFAVTYTHGDPANDPMLYLNGTLQAMSELYSPRGSAVADTAEMLIGNNSYLTWGYKSKIDTVRVYSQILSPPPQLFQRVLLRKRKE